MPKNAQLMIKNAISTDPQTHTPALLADTTHQSEQELTTEQVRALLEGITPGEWDTSREDMDSFVCREDDEVDHVVYIYRNPSERVPVFGGELDNARKDAALMAAAPILARDLLTERTAHAATQAELERLKAALAEAEARIGRVEAVADDWAARAKTNDGADSYPRTHASSAADKALNPTLKVCLFRLRKALAQGEKGGA